MSKENVGLFLRKVQENDSLKRNLIGVLKLAMRASEIENVDQIRYALIKFVSIANENDCVFTLEELMSEMVNEKTWINKDLDEILIKSGKKFARCLWDAVEDLYEYNYIRLCPNRR